MELGRLLAGARGYKVFAQGGAPLGALECVLYQQHVSHPDEIVVFALGFFRQRRRTFPFDAVAAISAQERTVALRSDTA